MSEAPARPAPRAARLLPRRVPAALAMLMAAGALLAIGWSVVLPPLQGPDEAAHIAAVTRLVESGEPIGGSDGLPRELVVLADQAGLGPLVGNVAARPAWTRADRERTEAALRSLSDRRAEFVDPETGPPTRGTASNPPLYTAYQAVPYLVLRDAPLLDRLFLMRVWNLPLLLATIVACWLLGAELFPRRPLAPVLMAGIAALQPQLGFIAGVVNPDILLVALTSWFCVVTVGLIGHGPDRRRLAAMVALAVAAAMTHPRGAALIPCAAVALALVIPWSAMPRRARLRTAAAVAGAAIAAAAAFALAASAAGVNVADSGLDTGRGASAREFASYVWQFYLPPLGFMDEPVGGDYGVRQVLETAWGTFASLEVRYPEWTYDAIVFTLAIVGVGAIAAAIRTPPSPRSVRVLILLATVAIATLLALHVAAYRLVLVDPSDPIIVGRHLLVLIAPFAALVMIVVTALGPRAGPAVAALVLGLLVTLDLAGIGLTMARFYT